MNREELIEEAAKAMQHDVYPGAPTWGGVAEGIREDWRNSARAAFAVFEKAHAPTDDERVSLASLIRSFSGWDADEVARYPQAASAVIADLTSRIEAALRRSEEPEWEYGYELIESDTRDVLTRSGAFESEEAAQHWAWKGHEAESNPDYPALDVLIVRRRKAGPWVPVKQELS